jgi:hypothetical protein
MPPANAVFNVFTAELEGQERSVGAVRLHRTNSVPNGT